MNLVLPFLLLEKDDKSFVQLCGEKEYVVLGLQHIFLDPDEGFPVFAILSLYE